MAFHNIRSLSDIPEEVYRPRSGRNFGVVGNSELNTVLEGVQADIDTKKLPERPQIDRRNFEGATEIKHETLMTDIDKTEMARRCEHALDELSAAYSKHEELLKKVSESALSEKKLAILSDAERREALNFLSQHKSIFDVLGEFGEFLGSDGRRMRTILQKNSPELLNSFQVLFGSSKLLADLPLHPDSYSDIIEPLGFFGRYWNSETHNVLKKSLNEYITSLKQ